MIDRRYRSLLVYALALIAISWSVEFITPLLLKPQEIELDLSSSPEIRIQRILVDGETLAEQQEIGAPLTENKLLYRLLLLEDGQRVRLAVRAVKTTTIQLTCLEQSAVAGSDSREHTQINSDKTTVISLSPTCLNSPFTILAPDFNWWIWLLTVCLVSAYWFALAWIVTRHLPILANEPLGHASIPLKEKIGMIGLLLIPLVFGLAAFWPGMYCQDGVDQWQQNSSGAYRNWHPIVHTWLQIGFTRMNFPAGLPIIQSLALLALGWRLISAFYTRLSKFGVLMMMLMLFYNPFTISALNSSWKDVLFSVALLWVGLDLVQIMRGQVLSMKKLLLVGIALFLVSTLRHNGAAVGLAVAILYFWRNLKSLKVAALGVMSLVIVLPLCYRLLGFGASPPKILTYTALHLLAGYTQIYPSSEHRMFVLQLIPPLHTLHYSPASIDWLILTPDLNHKAIRQAEPEIYSRLVKVFIHDSWTLMQLYGQQINILVRLAPNRIYPTTYFSSETFLDQHPLNTVFADVRRFLLEQEKQQVYGTAAWPWQSPPIIIVVALTFVCLIWFDSKQHTLLWLTLPSLLSYLTVLVSIPAQEYRYTLSLFWLLPLLLVVIASRLLQKILTRCKV